MKDISLKLPGKSPRQAKVIGLAVGERSASVAEVHAGDTPEVMRAAVFQYPDGVGLNTPDAIGAALGAFLKDKAFTARAVVIGVPAKWVLSKPREAPPADEQTINDSLRLQAEGEFSPDLKEMVFEFAGQTSSTHASPVLLMAMPKERLDQVLAIARGAELRAIAVTPIAAALGAASARAGSSRSILSLSAVGAEFTAQQGRSPRVMRHLGAASAPGPMLAMELRRASAMAPVAPPALPGTYPANGANGTNGAHAANGNGQNHLLLWDDFGLAPGVRKSLGEALGQPIEDGKVESLGVALNPVVPRSSAAPAAVALAVAGVGTSRPEVDFLHSRLAPPKEQGWLNQRNILIAAGVLLTIVLIVLAVTDLKRKRDELASIRAETDKRKDAVKVAQAQIDKITYAQSWQPGKPRYLACLRDITEAIPNDGQTFVTTLSLHSDMKGSITGKANPQQTTIEKIVEKLKDTKRFKDIKRSTDIRDMAKKGKEAATKEVTYKIEFTYVPKG